MTEEMILNIVIGAGWVIGILVVLVVIGSIGVNRQSARAIGTLTKIHDGALKVGDLDVAEKALGWIHEIQTNGSTTKAVEMFTENNNKYLEQGDMQS